MAVHLEDEQQRAIEHVHGPMLVVAGAGTGKTTVLVERIARLIRSGEAQPGEILAVTYTENAAKVLQQRVQRLVRKNCRGLQATTFHAYCMGVLTHSGQSFGVVDENDLYVYLRRRISELPLDHYSKAASPGQFLDALTDFFDRCHDELVEASDFARFVEGVAAGKWLPPRVVPSKQLGEVPQAELIARCREIAAVYCKVEEMLRDDGLGTFGHMILRAVQLLKADAQALAGARARARFLLIDEFQDANLAQIELAQLLAGPEQNIFAVGDPDQAIYRFRGASSAAFTEFARRFPAAPTVVLAENWRSFPPVLNCAFGIIDRNPAIECVLDGAGNPFQRHALISARAGPDQGQSTLALWPEVEIVVCRSNQEEAAEVASGIERLLDRRIRTRASATPRCGVLYRLHSHRQALVRELTQRGIPFTVRGVNVLETAAGRDLLAALRCLTVPADAESLFRVAAFPIFALDPETVREATYAAGSRTGNGESQHASFESVLRRVAGGEAVLAAVESARSEAHQSAMRASVALQIVLRQFQLDASSAAVGAFTGFVEAWEKKPITRTQSLDELLEYLEFFSQCGGSVELLPAQNEKDENDDDSDPGRVRLMTVHAAKGMEFDHVFLLRVRQSSFPTTYREKLFEFPPELRKSLSAEGEGKVVHAEEERRLFYVGMTRARDSLRVYAYPGRSRKDPRPTGLARELMDSPAASGCWRMRDAAAYTATLAAVGAAPTSGIASWILLPPSARLESPGLSASGIETYERCPLEFKLRRDWSLPGRVSGSLQFGAVMHLVLKDYYDALKAERPRSLPEVVGFFRSALEGVHFDDPVQRDLYLRDGMRQLTEFVALREQEEPPTVLQTERWFEMNLGGVPVRGRIDRVDRLGGSRVAIVDYKTGTAQTQIDADKSLQLSIYMMAAKSLWGLLPERLVLYNVADNSTVESQRTEAQLETARERIHDVAERIARGEFDPKPDYHCRRCLYRGLCPATEQDVALSSPARTPEN